MIPSKFLHVMLRVKDLETSIDFYTHLLGMKVLRKKDYPDGRFTLAFLGYEDESKETVIELTYNWDKYRYEKGTAFGHLAFAVKDLFTFCDHLRRHNAKFIREPAPMRFDSTELIAFIVDPDGYSIELINANAANNRRLGV